MDVVVVAYAGGLLIGGAVGSYLGHWYGVAAGRRARHDPADDHDEREGRR